jgi:glycogen debranching enzyme
MVDGNPVTFEWAVKGGSDGIAGRIKSILKVKVELEVDPAWSGKLSDIEPAKLGPDHLEIPLGSTTAEVTCHDSFNNTNGKWIATTEVYANHSLEFSLPAHYHAPITFFSWEAAEDYFEKTRTKADGDWGDFVSPISNQLGHSRVYSPDNERIAHTVSRGWCLPDGQVLFCWDSFFNGVLSSVENPAAGRDTVRAILAAQQYNGLVPNFAGRSWGVSSDRSQPPVGALCVWKMYQRDPDKAFLAEVYPKLLKWHRWWFSKRPNGKAFRDGNGDGLLEWGSETGDTQNARYESGLDDSPMYDKATMDGPNMKQDSVDLSALWAMDAEYLAKIATILGKKKDALDLYQDRDTMAKNINEKLWNDEAGVYQYKFWDGSFYNRLSPLNFYPMMAGVPSKDQADKMLNLFFQKDKFGGEYMAPTISRDDPAFPAQGYWRGTIWAPTNYLFFQGLRRYGTDARRQEFAAKSVALFMKNWNADGSCHENFNGITGEGRSDPHYTWGSLLCLIGIENLCDIEPDGRLRLNGDSGVTVHIQNFHLRGKTYDLVVKPNEAELRSDHKVFTAKGKAEYFDL